MTTRVRVQGLELIKPLCQNDLGLGVTRALVLRTHPQPPINYYYCSRFLALGTPHSGVLRKPLLMQVGKGWQISPHHDLLHVS